MYEINETKPMIAGAYSVTGVTAQVTAQANGSEQRRADNTEVSNKFEVSHINITHQVLTGVQRAGCTGKWIRARES